MSNFWIAFGLTLIAGLSTGIGSCIAFLSKSTNKKFLSISLGFSAGVMIYVSMIEIFAKAKDSLIIQHGITKGSWYTVLAFFGGMLVIGLIDRFIPIEMATNDITTNKSEETYDKVQAKKLKRMGMYTALAIAIHNFPEGLATFVSAMKDPSLAIPIVVAIAIHNIPEGVAVSVPIYQATGSKKKAFFYSFISGLAEPIGALVGWFLLMPFMSETVFGIIFAGVAGIMVFIAFDELFPTAIEYGDHHISVYGLVSGMGVMALSLLLFV
ncbi:MAG: zinc transporter ZupT [Lachnospirales bacterium]